MVHSESRRLRRTVQVREQTALKGSTSGVRRSGAHHKGGAVGLAIVDHAEQDAIVLLHIACWARHKDELLAETAPARAPALHLTGLCVEAHKHLRSQ